MPLRSGPGTLADLPEAAEYAAPPLHLVFSIRRERCEAAHGCPGSQRTTGSPAYARRTLDASNERMLVMRAAGEYRFAHRSFAALRYEHVPRAVDLDGLDQSNSPLR